MPLVEVNRLDWDINSAEIFFHRLGVKRALSRASRGTLLKLVVNNSCGEQPKHFAANRIGDLPGTI